MCAKIASNNDYIYARSMGWPLNPADAVAAGIDCYYTGDECPCGHNGKLTLSGRCYECHNKPLPVMAPAAGVVLSRAGARFLGLTRYFDGKACRRGHISQRYVSTGGCIMCKP